MDEEQATDLLCHHLCTPQRGLTVPLEPNKGDAHLCVCVCVYLRVCADTYTHLMDAYAMIHTQIYKNTFDHFPTANSCNFRLDRNHLALDSFAL